MTGMMTEVRLPGVHYTRRARAAV